LQWQNLMPLVENSLATGGKNLIVGDGKQAIYRWRGGEVEQFVNIPYLRGSEDSKLLQDRIHYIKAFVKENNLGTNYRSLKNIVEFNNALFTNIAVTQDEFTQKIFAEITQKFLPENQGGYVEIQVYNDHKDTEQTFDEFNIERTISCINDLINQGYKYSDIAILGRNNSSLIKLVEAFKESPENIPMISSEAMLLDKSEKVRLLCTYLKLVISPEDHHEQLRLLFLLDKVHDINENLFEKAYSIIKSKTFENFELILASLGFDIDLISRGKKDAFEVLEQALVDLKLTQSADAYLMGFMNEATQFYRGKGTSLGRFLEYFEERKEKLSLSIPGGINAVQLLTIHKSKGLEFPVVIYPFADYDAKYYGRMWVDVQDEVNGLNRFLIKKGNDLELTRFAADWGNDKRQTDLDEINVLYVACTRAVEQLYVFTSNAKRKMLNKLILPATKNMEGWKDEFNFSFGTKQRLIKKEEEEKNKPTSKIFDLKPLSLKSMHSYPEGDRFEYIFPQSNNLEFGKLSASDYGELVHETFAKILFEKDANRVIERVRIKKNLSEETYLLLKADINRVLTNPEILPFFQSSNARMELEFWDENGKLVRMDRVVVIKDEHIVIDFKTGEEDEDHFNQVRNYKKILKTVYKNGVRGYLIYTESGKLIEVD
ncbi:MAG: UvrD-helicase domain-containing protein, partial [Salibacteraceae bacterium]